MSENEMPAAEATAVVDETNESNHYEFAFHVLPTVAEGEVAGVFEALKAHITKAGGEFTTEEAPARVDLAYEIVKPIDGKNRKFGSAYFGWTRFKLSSNQVAELTSELEDMPELLRSLMIKLTRAEEVEPFYFHETMKSQKQVETVGDAPESASTITTGGPATPADGAIEDDEDVSGDVSDEELDDSLDKITK